MRDAAVKLRWRNHESCMSSMFHSLLSKGSLVDITLACEGQYIQVHRVVLAASSPYFEKLLSVDTNRQPIIILRDTKFSHVTALVEFMYRGEVQIQKAEIESLVLLAQSLQIRGLAEDTLPQHESATTSTSIPNPNASISSHPSATASFAKSQHPIPIVAPALIQNPSMTTSTSSRHFLSTTAASSTTRKNYVLPPLNSLFISKNGGRRNSCHPRIQSPQQIQVLDDSLRGDTQGEEEDIDEDHEERSEDAKIRIVDFKSKLKEEEAEDDESQLLVPSVAESAGETFSATGFSKSVPLSSMSTFSLFRMTSAKASSTRNVHPFHHIRKRDFTDSESLSKGKYPCPNLNCGRLYSTSGTLTRHVTYECFKEPQFSCKFCGRKIKLRTNLVAHEKRCRLKHSSPGLFLNTVLS